MRNKLHSYLGFARKSGKLVSGYETCINLIKRNKIKLILITDNASEGTQEKFRRLTESAGVPIIFVKDGDAISEYSGLYGRNVFGITDRNFAEVIAKEIETMRM